MIRDDDNTAPYEGSDLEALATLHRYQRWIVETFQPYLSGRAIEFGAGIGNISALIRIIKHKNNLEIHISSPKMLILL